MTITAYDFESGTNGATVNAGGAILAVSSSKPTYSTAAAFTSSTLGVSSGAQQWAEWAAPATDWSGSVYIKPTTNPGSGTARFVSMRTAAAAQGISIRLSSTGVFQIANAGNSLAGAASSTTWTTGDEFRIEWQLDTVGADVQITVRIFKNADISGTTPTETMPARTITGTDVARVRMGNVDSGAFTILWDNLQLSDTLEWIGPYVPAVTPLDTPVVTVTIEDPPSTPGGTDGSCTVTWPAVTSADHYVAGIVSGLDATSGFTITSTSATSPYTFTGLAAGNYTVAIKAAAA